MPTPTAVVVHLNVARAIHRKAPQKLLNEREQAEKLAPWIHFADMQLGRSPDVAWQDLPFAEREQKIERAAVAIRLGDQTAVAAAAEHAAAHVDGTVGLDVPPSTTVRRLVSGAVRIAFSHLSGHIGGAR